MNNDYYYTSACLFIAVGVLLAWFLVNGLYGASCTTKSDYTPIVVHFYEH